MHLRFPIAMLTVATFTGSPQVAPAAEPRPLDAVLRCNAEAVGADALAQLDAVAYRLEIAEPGFTVDGHYRATRDGRVRIDIRAAGERVFAEGLYEDQAWMWRRGEEQASPGSDKGADALRHGIQQPGHFHALIHIHPRPVTATGGIRAALSACESNPLPVSRSACGGPRISRRAGPVPSRRIRGTRSGAA